MEIKILIQKLYARYSIHTKIHLITKYKNQILAVRNRIYVYIFNTAIIYLSGFLCLQHAYHNKPIIILLLLL